MNFAMPLFLGFVTASVGIIPPGLINMTAAKVSLNEGRTRAFVFASGATLVVLVQTFIAVLFARFIDKNPGIVIMLREAGLAVFALLTVYFLLLANKTDPKTEEVKLKSKRSRFFLGMLLSALNFFPIPFYVFVSVTLATYHYFSFEKPFIYTFVFGAGAGAFFAFYCYIAFFKKMETKTNFILRNMNNIIGSITALVSIIALINIIRFYWK
jgi:threonine/homoserine/homoserine lactone efflux protein